jgi:hypothetical protein
MFSFSIIADDQWVALNGKLDYIIGLLSQENTMATLQELADQVRSNTSAERSATIALQDLATKFASAQATNDSGQIQALISELQSSAQPLAAAIVANTPAVPASPAAPSQTGPQPPTGAPEPMPLPQGVTLPPGTQLPPGVALPPGVTIPSQTDGSET